MRNEVLLIFNLILVYGGILLFYYFFRDRGLIAFAAAATVLANIEVMLLVDAFGMEQTLGNVMFASTFLITDILSENEGRERANQAVNVGIGVSLLFIVVSQLWLLYIPSGNDWAYASFKVLFSNTPRIVIAGFVVYAVVQKIDIVLYHKWWRFTENKFGDRRKMLWLRNNGSTLISQFINAVLFNLLAFGGRYDIKTLVTITAATYILYIAAALSDTPAVYLARKISEKRQETK